MNRIWFRTRDMGPLSILDDDGEVDVEVEVDVDVEVDVKEATLGLLVSRA